MQSGWMKVYNCVLDDTYSSEPHSLGYIILLGYVTIAYKNQVDFQYKTQVNIHLCTRLNTFSFLNVISYEWHN